MLDPKTVTQDKCPESYLQLLSLRNELDGFLILKNFIFLRSPQLDGKYRDFRTGINNIIINPGEHIRTFYGRALWLSNEISLADLADGSLAVLHERFIALLRDTHCPIIVSETSMYWRQIREHRRDPSKIQAPLPWTFNDVLRSLETAGVEILTNNNDAPTTTSPTLIPSFAASSTTDHLLHIASPGVYPIANATNAYHHNSHNNNNKNTTRHHTHFIFSSETNA
jgi:hypothetical protein